MAKLFADAGVICIASLISPYKRDRDACRALLPEGDFIEVSVSTYFLLFNNLFRVFWKDKVKIMYDSEI